MSDRNVLDRLVAWYSPVRALRRQQARRLLAYYEAGRPDTLRKQRRETGTGNDAVLRAGASIRQQARHMEQNYDLALGVLNTLVANVVGPGGIGIEPQPRKADGTIHDDLSREILDLFKDWARSPEVTRQHDWPSAQRMLCRAWMRDGEVFSQLLLGAVPLLSHNTRVPLSLEMLEADFVPLDMQSSRPLIEQGVELNGWGAPVAYHVYKQNPLSASSLVALGQTKRIDARNMLHLAHRNRIRQLRGVSIFASVMHRFDDLKDYEESERIAAKIAASMAAFIRKGSPDQYEEAADGSPRQLAMRPGMIFDDLKPGEEIGTIDTSRPNPNLEAYRSSQLKAIAAGCGPTYSAIARTYDGTYSAQRQELVEGWNIYGVLASEFIGRIVRPVYEAFIAMAVAGGELKLPAGVRPDTLTDAEYLAPQMPWIDPVKEVTGWGMLEDRAYASGPEIVRRRGGNPLDVIEQQARWLRAKEAAGVPPANAAAPASALPAPDPDEEPAKPVRRGAA
jgi:lambda family phage portal protein